MEGHRSVPFAALLWLGAAPTDRPAQAKSDEPVRDWIRGQALLLDRKGLERIRLHENDTCRT